MKAIIMAAGYGTRFLPVTKTIAKEMIPIVNIPAIQFVVDELLEAGIKDILIISHRKKKALEDFFDRDPELETFFYENKKENLIEKITPPKANITFIRQQYMNGSGNALLLAESFIGDSPFVLVYPDDIVLAKTGLTSQLINIYNKYHKSILACEAIEGDVSRYGVIKYTDKISDTLYVVNSIVEKPKTGTEPSKTISIGRYLLTPEIFNILKECYKQFDGQGEFVITEGLGVLAKKESLLSYIYEGERLDVGDPEGYVVSILKYVKQQPQYKNIINEIFYNE